MAYAKAKVFTLHQLGLKENREALLLTHIELEDLPVYRKDLRNMDPDWMRLPNGQALAFQELNGVIQTLEPVSAKEDYVLRMFFDDYDNNFVSPGTGWADFGGDPNRRGAGHASHTNSYRIAYRGGQGYGYGISEFTGTFPADIDQQLPGQSMHLVDEFTQGYLEAMLTLMDDEEDERTKNVQAEQLSPDSWATILKECALFQADNKEPLEASYAAGRSESAAGCHFYLSRGGWSAPFIEGDYPEEAGQALDEAADKFGGCDVYLGDDNLAYFQSYHKPSN